MKQKKRLDIAIQELYPQLSRQQIQSLIMQGKATINDIVTTKSGTQVTLTDKVVLLHSDQKYVSRAGYKLEYALDKFNIDVNGLIVLDAGISTGGFSDCLLQRGVARIYGIDVGYGQTAHKIRSDPRVILHERTNLRHITKDIICESVDLVTLDLSFISILKVLDAVKSVLKPNGLLITLIKPQFEASRYEVGSGGIVRDDAIRQRIVKQVIDGIVTAGFRCHAFCESIIQGTDGNREYVAYFQEKNNV